LATSKNSVSEFEEYWRKYCLRYGSIVCEGGKKPRQNDSNSHPFLQCGLEKKEKKKERKRKKEKEKKKKKKKRKKKRKLH